MKQFQDFEIYKVSPVGWLHVGELSYLLTVGAPIREGTDWVYNDPDCNRFVVMPNTTVGYYSESDDDTPDFVYAHQRHIITNAPFIIEYVDMNPVYCALTEFDEVSPPANSEPEMDNSTAFDPDTGELVPLLDDIPAEVNGNV